MGAPGEGDGSGCSWDRHVNRSLVRGVTSGAGEGDAAAVEAADAEAVPGADEGDTPGDMPGDTPGGVEPDGVDPQAPTSMTAASPSSAAPRPRIVPVGLPVRIRARDGMPRRLPLPSPFPLGATEL